MARKFMIVPHTHWDREWYLTFEEFRLKLHKTVTTLVDIMSKEPGYAHFHMDGQSVIFEDLLEFDDKLEDFFDLVKTDRVSAGPWYVLPDEFLVSPEALIRNLTMGIEVASKYARPMMIGYLPDQFGHVSQMPQILAGFGIEDAVLWRGVGNEVKNANLWWEAPDGSRIFTAYMPQGYSNAMLLPKDPDAMKTRLIFAEAELAPFTRQENLLLMNGSDHQPPQGFLVSTLGAAMEKMPGYSYEICSLARYFSEVKAEAVNLPVHKGEFRSPAKSPLLPGCASARAHLKRIDFRASSLMERVAEPFAALDVLSGGPLNREAFTRAWKLLLKNHPHDSICGCSVDEVHRETETRYMKVEKLAQVLAREAQTNLAGRLNMPSHKKGTIKTLLAFRPSLAQKSAEVVMSEISSTEDLSKAGIFDMKGKPVPFHLEPVGEVMKLMNITVPKALASLVISSISGGDFGGFNLCGGQLRIEGDTLHAEFEADLRPWGPFDMEAFLAKLEAMLEKKSVNKIHLRAQTPQRYKAVIVPQALKGMTLSPLVLKNATKKHKSSMKAGKNYIENAHYKVFLEDGKGLGIRDKALGVKLPTALYFEDQADRGDEYNFDPVEKDRPVKLNKPEIVSTNRIGNAAVQMHLQYRGKIPAALEKSRNARSKETVPLVINLTVNLFEGVKRVEFEAEFENNAFDHRLRAILKAPGQVSNFHVGSAFDLVERPLKPEKPGKNWAEQPIGTSPQWNVSALDMGDFTLAAVAPGVTEVEPLCEKSSGSVAMTLLRSVGWLSRADLKLRPGNAGPPMETPEAQCLGANRAAFALEILPGYDPAKVLLSADSYVHRPQLLFAPESNNGPIELEKPFISVDNTNILMSAFYPARSKAGAVVLRLYNGSGSTETALIELFDKSMSVRPVDFNEKPKNAKFIKVSGGKYSLTFGPNQILTLLLN